MESEKYHPFSMMCVVVVCVLCIKDCHGRGIYFRCYNEMMDKTLCDTNSYIRIISADYADNGAVTSCSDSSLPSGVCRASIYNENRAYYDEIKIKCNGFRACQNLRAGKEDTHCNSWYNPKTDWVVITYDCIQVTTPTPPTTRPTTTTTTTTTSTPFTTTTFYTSTLPYASSTADNDSFTSLPPEDSVTSDEVLPSGQVTEAAPGVTDKSAKEPEKKKENLGVLIAVPIIAVIFIVLTILLIVLLLKRRRSKSKEKTPENTAGPANGAISNQASGMMFNNAVYENAETLNIRGHQGYLYDRAATVKLPPGGTLSDSPGRSLPNTPDGTLTSTPVSNPGTSQTQATTGATGAASPDGTRELSSYMDMSFGTIEKPKKKKSVLEKMKLSKKDSKKASKKEGLRVDLPAIPPDGATCSSCGAHSPSSNGTGAVENVYTMASEPVTEADGVYENPYAISDIPIGNNNSKNRSSVSSEMKNDYTEMKDPSGKTSSDPRDSGHYSAIMEPSRLEDIEGVYSVPRNSSSIPRNGYSVPRNSSSSSSGNISSNPGGAQPVEITYENIESKKRSSDISIGGTVYQVPTSPSQPLSPGSFLVDNVHYVSDA